MLYRSLMVASSLAMLALPVQAQMTFQQVSARQAQGQQGSVPKLNLSPTWGLTLSFIPTGERIQQVRIGDPSRILVDFDSPLSSTQSGGGATLVYLRQLGQPLELGLRLSAAARQTNQVPLSVVTVGMEGRKLYQFQLLLDQETSVSTVEVVPQVLMPQSRPLSDLVRGQPGVAPLPPLSPLYSPSF